MSDCGFGVGWLVGSVLFFGRIFHIFMVGKFTLVLRNAFLVCYCPVAASQYCQLSWHFQYCFYFVS